MRTPRRASIVAAAAGAGLMLAACGGGGGTSAGHPAGSPATQAGTAPSAPAQTSAGGSPATPHFGSTGLTGGCVLGIYDQSQNQFYQLLGLAHGSGIKTGDPISEAYQVTLADSPTKPAATVTGFTIAVYADGRKLTTTSEHLSPRKVIPSGQVMTFTEHPWGTSKAGEAMTVGPFAASGKVGANLAATCSLLRVDTR